MKISKDDYRRVGEMLNRLREMRDARFPGSEMHSIFNDACYRLGILESKLREVEKSQ